MEELKLINGMNTWQYHFDYIQKSDSFSGEDKNRVLNGLLKLREFFTDNWLKEANDKFPRHPIISYIANCAPWSQFWLADLGRRLDCIKHVKSFKQLLERLKNTDQYGGAEVESDSLYRLVTAGFSTELYPKINIGNRRADIKAILSGQEYYFEITDLESSKKAIAASHTFDALTFPYSFAYSSEIIVQCKIHKALAEPRIKEQKTKIEQAINQVRQNKNYIHICELGIIDYLIIHKDLEGQIDALLSQCGMKRGISGPSFQVDDVRRLEAKIWQENRQLPKDKPGIIVMYSNITYFSGDAAVFYNELAYDIEDTIFEHDNLVMGIIVGHEGGLRDKETLVNASNYLFSKIYLNDFFSECVLIIPNKYSRFASLPTNENVIETFRNHRT